MPQLGLTMEQGTVLRWIKGEGERVERGEPLLVIMTEKVEYEMESPGAGVVRKIVAEEGAVLPVGKPMAIIGAPDEDIAPVLADVAAAAVTAPTPTAAPAPAAAPAPPPPPAPAPAVPAVTRPPGERVKISPLARRIAEEHGLDYRPLAGTGPEGRIVKEDVERALAARAAAPAVAETIPLRGIRRVIMDRMSESWRVAPRVTMVSEVDMTRAAALRRERGEAWEREAGFKLSYNDLILKATAIALTERPRINCSLEGDQIRVHRRVHLAFALDLGEGLLAPVIKDAHLKSLIQLARAVRDLSERGRAGRLGPDELTGGTFTVTNLGGYGIDLFTPIINQPQAAILGVGRIADKPVVLNGGIHIRTMVNLCLVFDHRLIDGAPAAQFQARLKELLEAPDDWAK
jgi:pyruvate dehydrogenase E2 component (dihydrolipoamide acetyltransferase)